MAKKSTRKAAAPKRTAQQTKKRTAAKPAPKRPSGSVALTVRNSRGTGMQPRAVDLNVDRVIGVGEVALGAVGLQELKLTAKEEEVLSEAVREDDVLLRPGKKGPAIPYLPHTVYSRWFSRAFGRIGWSIVPVSQPVLKGKSVIIQFVLSVHGVPVATAAGEQDYFEDNPQQSYGDVVESCVGSALRRCAKRLGVGLEMWDKEFCERMRQARQHTLPKEYRNSGNSGGGEGSSAKPQTRTGSEGAGISEGQVRRIFAICKTAQRKQGEVRKYLKALYKLDGKDLADVFAGITRKDYDQICAAIEKRGPLPMKPLTTAPDDQAREPQGREPDEVLPPVTEDTINWNMR